MIVFAGLIPHTPLLHAGIGADVSGSLEDLHAAVSEALDDLYATHPTTLVLISDHPISYDDHVTVHVQDPISFDLSEFGDFSVKEKVSPHLGLIDRLQRHMRRSQHRLTLDSTPTLHFSSAIPLHLVLKRIPNIRLVAISAPTNIAPKELFEIAQDMQEVFSDSQDRIAILAAGDGSHSLSNRSPHDPTPEGPEFDTYIQHILSNRNVSSLLNLDSKLVHGAHQALYEQLIMLFGITHGIQLESQLHAYHAPFGVGYFVASYQLPNS